MLVAVYFKSIFYQMVDAVDVRVGRTESGRVESIHVSPVEHRDMLLLKESGYQVCVYQGASLLFSCAVGE